MTPPAVPREKALMTAPPWSQQGWRVLIHDFNLVIGDMRALVQEVAALKDRSRTE
jgi:hypothetical protein